MSPSAYFAAGYFALVAVLSAVAFLAYAWDKKSARLDRPRVPEKTLHLLALFGGWPGAWFAQRSVRHKTKKVRFQLVFWLTVVTHLLSTFLLAYFVWIRRAS